MSIFDNYENLSSTYVPNNQKKIFEEQKIFDQDVPKKEYDTYGRFIGYSFSYGDTVRIPYFINKVIYVEEDAIIYELEGGEPTEDTVGYKGQKAYNIKTVESWVCESLDSSIYSWKKLNNFTYPENGTKKVTLESNKYSDVDKIKFNIYNFRWEEVYSKEFLPSQDFNIFIDKELSDKLVSGIYNCSVDFYTNNSFYTDGTFVLIVKNSVQDTVVASKKAIESFIEDGVAEYAK